jgi:hypothetical protein
MEILDAAVCPTAIEESSVTEHEISRQTPDWQSN